MQVSTPVGNKQEKNPHTNTSVYLKGEQSMLHLHWEGPTCPLGRRLSNDCRRHLCWNLVMWAKKCPPKCPQDAGCWEKVESQIRFPEQVIAVFLGASLPRETPVQSVWLFVFSTDLLLHAVTFIRGILDEPFPSLILVLIQTLRLGRTMQEQRVHSGKLLC